MQKCHRSLDFPSLFFEPTGIVWTFQYPQDNNMLDTGLCKAIRKKVYQQSRLWESKRLATLKTLERCVSWNLVSLLLHLIPLHGQKIYGNGSRKRKVSQRPNANTPVPTLGKQNYGNLTYLIQLLLLIPNIIFLPVLEGRIVHMKVVPGAGEDLPPGDHGHHWRWRSPTGSGASRTSSVGRVPWGDHTPVGGRVRTG